MKCKCGDEIATVFYQAPVRNDECTDCYIWRTSSMAAKKKRLDSPEVAVTPDGTLPQGGSSTRSPVAVSSDGRLTAELLTELEAEKSEIVKAMVTLKDFPIETTADLELAADLVNDVVEKRKKVDARLKAITKPMREAEESVRELFRPVQAAIAEVENWLKKHIAEAQANIDRLNKEKMLAVEAAMKAGAPEAATALAAKIESAATPAGVQVKEHWSIDIVDPGAVPREWCKPDEARIRAAVQASKGKIEIPGVANTRTDIVAATGRRAS